MKDYMTEFEAHLNKITESVLDDEVNEAGMEMTSQQRKLANYGRILMDQAATTKNDELSNIMASVGNELTNFGATFGASSLDELVRKTGATKEVIKKLLAYAEKIDKQKASLTRDHTSGGLDDTNDTADDFQEPDDDEMAAQADRAARGMS